MTAALCSRAHREVVFFSKSNQCTLVIFTKKGDRARVVWSVEKKHVIEKPVTTRGSIVYRQPGGE